MGAWGTKPWENDAAADWLKPLIVESGLPERVQEALEGDLDMDHDIARAAAWLLAQIANTYTWPGGDLLPQIHKAIEVLERLKENELYADPAFQAELDDELRRLRDKARGVW